MSVLQNVVFTLKLRGIEKSLRKSKALYYLNKVGLASYANKYPSQLSGGMRQRLALARALSVEPKIILMDEPFAAVDSLTREKLQDELLALWHSTGITIVMVTHDIDEAVYLSDQIIVFSPQPGTIRNVYNIDTPRPRRRSDIALTSLKERIVKLFKYDIDNESDFSI